MVSSKPSCRTAYTSATRRPDIASSAMPSAKRSCRTVAAVGSTGESHGAVAFATVQMLAPIADGGVPLASCCQMAWASHSAETGAATEAI